MYTFPRVIKTIKWFLLGNSSQRRRVKQELVRIFAYWSGGFFIGDDYKIWINDKIFIKNCIALSPQNTYSQERKYMLREWLRYVKNVKGSLAECGCYQGASAFFMASEFPDTPLHLFDSFEGLSRPLDIDQPLHADQVPWGKGFLKTSEDLLKENLKNFNNINVHKGWIPHRFFDVDNEDFRFIHIDVDLYEPTYESLKFFYPRLLSGGVIILDDFGFENCIGAHKAAVDFMKDKPEYIVHSPTGQGIIIKE